MESKEGELQREFPEYHIKNNDGAAVVTVILRPGEEFIAESGVISYVRQGSTKPEQLKVKTSSNGIFKGLKRCCFAGEAFFQNKLMGPDQGQVEVTMSGPLLGAIMALRLEPHQSFSCSKRTFIGSSTNVKVATKFRARGLCCGGEGAFLTKVKTNESPGLVFLACYGSIERFDLKDGEEVLVDNGLFLACDSHKKYTFTKLAGTKSFFFGGEGILMKFKGPGTVYTQTRAPPVLPGGGADIS